MKTKKVTLARGARRDLPPRRRCGWGAPLTDPAAANPRGGIVATSKQGHHAENVGDHKGRRHQAAQRQHHARSRRDAHGREGSAAEVAHEVKGGGPPTVTTTTSRSFAARSRPRSAICRRARLSRAAADPTHRPHARSCAARSGSAAELLRRSGGEDPAPHITLLSEDPMDRRPRISRRSRPRCGGGPTAQRQHHARPRREAVEEARPAAAQRRQGREEVANIVVALGSHNVRCSQPEDIMKPKKDLPAKSGSKIKGGRPKSSPKLKSEV